MPRFTPQLLIALLLLLLSGFSPASAHDSEAPGPFGEPVRVNSLGRAALGIQVQTVERKMLPMEIKVPGSIQMIPSHQYDQHSPVSGVISRVNVNLGQLVKQGQPLLVVESPEMNQLAATLLQDRLDLESTIATQKAALDEEVRQAQERYDLAEFNQKRLQKLYDERISSQKDLQQAQTDLALATTRVRTAKQNREIVLRTLTSKLALVLNPLRQRLSMLGVKPSEIETMLSKQTTDTSVPVLAARSGFITSIAATPGKSIDSGLCLFKISDQSKVWATAQIYEDDMSRVKLGQHVEVKVQALHNEMVEGTLSYIGTEVDPATRTLAVRTELANPNYRLKPDMYAELYIHTAGTAPVIAVPREATVQQRGRDVVFLERKDAYQPQFVRLGRSVGDYVEVISGLQVGDRVVTRGAFQLGAQMVKDSGDASQFAAATEGEHLEDHESAGAAGGAMNLSWQALLVIAGGAFLLGVALCSVFLVRTNDRSPSTSNAPSGEENGSSLESPSLTGESSSPGSYPASERAKPGTTTGSKGRDS